MASVHDCFLCAKVNKSGLVLRIDMSQVDTVEVT